MNKKNRFTQNIVANLGIRLWTVASNFLFVPLYIRFLGEETYGLVTFFSTMQAILNLLGLGLSKTIRREFAVLENDDRGKIKKYKILRSVEFVYVCISLIIIALCGIGAKKIAGKWLTFQELSIDTVERVIFLMGISIAIQLVAGMLQGCLFGMEKQIEGDLIQFIWSVLKNVGVIFLLWIFCIDIIIFYVWYIITDILYFFGLRLFIIKYLKNTTYALRWKLKEIVNIKTIWRYAAGLFFISLCNVGADKIIVSNAFNLTVLGTYNTVTMLGNFCLIISSSVGVAVFSRFSSLYSEGKKNELSSFYFDVNNLVNVSVCCISAFVSAYIDEILLFWTHAERIVDIARSGGAILVIALSFAALHQISYEYMLSTGVVFVDNIRSVLTVIAIAIILPLGISAGGFSGAAIVMLCINFVSLILYMIVVNYYLRRSPLIGVLKDFVIPMALFLLVANLSHQIILLVFGNPYIVLGFGITCGCAVMLIFYYKGDVRNRIRVLNEKQKEN